MFRDRVQERLVFTATHSDNNLPGSLLSVLRQGHMTVCTRCSIIGAFQNIFPGSPIIAACLAKIVLADLTNLSSLPAPIAFSSRTVACLVSKQLDSLDSRWQHGDLR